jgi:hypothetical protein
MPERAPAVQNGSHKRKQRHCTAVSMSYKEDIFEELNSLYAASGMQLVVRFEYMMQTD